MAEPENAGGHVTGSSEKLYTLSEISQRTGISMPTLQRYKKTYQSRIPSVGLGRKQRYPEAALPVFGELRSENAGRRGRPRKDASARPAAAAAKPAAGRGRGGRAARRPGRPRRAAGATRTPRATAAKPARTRAAARPGRPPARRGPGRPPGRATARRAAAGAGRGRRAAGGRRAGAPRAAARGRGRAAAGARGGRSSGLLTLTRISELTGISYPTLVRYVRLYSDRLPHEGKGRARRFYQEAVEVFRRLRQESGRGGRRKGSTTTRGAGRGGAGRGSAGEGLLARQLRKLEKAQQNMEKKFKRFAKDVQKLFK
jgi:predicted DNA-binding transcriptional regulator AlpA